MEARRAALYTRRGCPPCFALRRLARRAARRHGLPLEEFEVSGDPALEARYGTEVPVLVLPGLAPLSGKVGAERVEAAFRAASHRGEAAPVSWRERLRRWLAHPRASREPRP